MKQKSLTVEWISERIRKNQYLFSLHADEERRNDLLDIVDVENVLLNGTILEDYTEDKRGTSCLVVGEVNGKSVHVVCGKNKSDWLVIITVYIPAKPKWLTPTKRCSK